MKLPFASLETQYRNALLNDVLPFWLNHSIDDHGGFFTCLDRDGAVYDTDKFVWLQARQVWTLSMLSNRLQKNSAWLDVARHGVTFLRAHGRDRDGAWYFSLNRDGDPLVQPYNIFSDCFAAMAFSQYALATGDDEARGIALKTFRAILSRKDNPKGIYTKTVGWSRPLKSYALPMILLNVVKEVAWMLPVAEREALEQKLVDEVVGLFIDKETGLVYEHVAPDGSHPDTFEGRVLNPGHGIEGMWFLMDLALNRRDVDLVQKALRSVFTTLERGWDTEYGGIFAFLDARGKPPLQMEWDQKLWWVHVETLVALLMGYAATGREDCLTWFERVHDYTWKTFQDPGHGEWWGYMNRRGELLLPLKGGKWKGCFHMPRCLYLCAELLGGLVRSGGKPYLAA